MQRTVDHRIRGEKFMREIWTFESYQSGKIQAVKNGERKWPRTKY